MDIELIRALAAVLRENDLGRIEIAENSTRICIEAQNACSRPMQMAEKPAEETPLSMLKNEPLPISFTQSATVKSPLVGTVYLKPSVEAVPYVSVGSKVQKGDVLCLVEAMKMFNDITATCAGTIKEICVSNGDSVDYGQILFVIEE